MEHLYFNKEVETMSREAMRELQSKRLIDTVKRVYDNVPLYRKKMDDIGLLPGDIKSIDDLHKLPYTYKTDLRDAYPYGMFAVPIDDVARIHASSGTTGKQTVVGYTNNDLHMWAECVARGLASIGVTKKDFIHVSYGYGLFTGGLGLHDGGQLLGATVIPASTGNTARQMQILQDFKSSVLCCTPSYALYLGEALRENNISLDKIHLKYGVFGAEPWSENMRKEIEKSLGIKAFDIYGLSEVAGPGVSCNCMYQDGLHVQEDHFVPEIINSETGEVLPEGAQGELVFTCITKEALPLLRYRTKDICSLNYQTCKCGRTTVRMSKPCGRADDMLIIRGVNVFPSQIESVLMELEYVAPHYMIYVDRINNLDVMEVQVEMTPGLFSDTVRGLQEKERQMKKKIEDTLGISVNVRLVEPHAIERTEGKGKHVIDRRTY